MSVPILPVNITELNKFHTNRGRHATVTATKPPVRFGALQKEKNNVSHVMEKPIGDGNFINGVFFVLSPKVFDYIADDSIVWERGPMETLAYENQMSAYMHNGFWQPMDTLRDKTVLEELWNSGRAPWKTWT